MKSWSGVDQRSTRVGSGDKRRANLPQRVWACGPGTHHAGRYVCSPGRDGTGAARDMAVVIEIGRITGKLIDGSSDLRGEEERRHEEGAAVFRGASDQNALC